MTKTTPKRLLKEAPLTFGPLDAVFLYLFGALLLVLVLAAAAPAVLHLQPFVVTSGSMEPAFSRGDLIYTQAAAFDELSVGDVVTFQSDSGILTHRIYSIDLNTASLRTKADASPYLDPVSVTEDMVIGRPAYRIPLLGHITLFFQDPQKGGDPA